MTVDKLNEFWRLFMQLTEEEQREVVEETKKIIEGRA